MEYVVVVVVVVVVVDDEYRNLCSYERGVTKLERERDPMTVAIALHAALLSMLANRLGAGGKWVKLRFDSHTTEW